VYHIGDSFVVTLRAQGNVDKKVAEKLLAKHDVKLKAVTKAEGVGF